MLPRPPFLFCTLFRFLSGEKKEDMQGSGNTYAYSGETTEWEDILIKKGIVTKDSVLIGKGLNPEDFKKSSEVEEDEDDVDHLESCNLDELNLLEEDDDFADSNILDSYRQQRLKELKEQAAKNRFGELLEIVKDDWIREVTDSSNCCSVVVHLYESSSVECQIVDEALKTLASKFRYIKFLKIKSTQAIENWPERNLPTIFIYEKGALKTQILTLSKFGGKTATTDDFEWFFAVNGVVTDSELTEDPRSVSQRKQVKKWTASSSFVGEDTDD